MTANEQLQREITERKKAEASLQASLAEKVVLLREVHHRVKNNLAAISGLIQMQRRAIRDAPSVAALTDMESRIRSMAIIHENLYRSKDFARIDFHGYLEDLISQIRNAFGSPSGVRFVLAEGPVEMVLDDALPCGLIVNELITNALKYAFPETHPVPVTQDFEIAVKVECEGSAYTLTVSDNGVGFPADLDWRTTKTLGLHLVEMLGEHQLDGSIELDRTRGTRFILRFNSLHEEE
jgi:two-component sensor histidine kinase